MSNNLIDVQQMKNAYNTEKQMITLGLLNIRSLSAKALFVNYMITDHNLDLLSWQNLAKTGWIHYFERVYPPKNTVIKMSRVQKANGEGVTTIYSNILSISQKTGSKHNSFQVMVLHIL